MQSTANQVALGGRSVHVLGGARTPMAEYAGLFSDLSANDLGALALKGALERSGVAPEQVEHVVMGNALQTSGDAIYGARHVGLKAGIPVEVPAVTVNRLCGSGIQAIADAARLIALGECAVVAAGGMENMTQAPHVIRGARRGFRLGEGRLEDSLMVALLDTWCGFQMAQTSDNVAREHGISRADQDAYALRSQQAAAAASEAGRFQDEIVKVKVRVGREEKLVGADDHGRPDTTLAGLAKLKPAFGADGMVTAGNASGIVDGAAAVILAGAEAVAAASWRPLGRIVSFAVAGVEPKLMGMGPVPAIRKALHAAGLGLEQVDLFEINEAFAGQYLAVERALELPREKVNVNGGAIALGHPLAATGTRLVLTVLLELRRRGGGRGVASACIGGGQGIAMVVEAAGA